MKILRPCALTIHDYSSSFNPVFRYNVSVAHIMLMTYIQYSAEMCALLMFGGSPGLKCKRPTGTDRDLNHHMFTPAGCKLLGL